MFFCFILMKKMLVFVIIEIGVFSRDLNYNEISYMVEDRSGAFLPLGQLTSLGLAHNQIKSVNKNAFTGLSRVTELDLTGNDITSIQDAAFQVMTNLRELKLNSSKKQTFTIFHQLKHLIFNFK